MTAPISLAADLRAWIDRAPKREQVGSRLYAWVLAACSTVERAAAALDEDS